MPFKANDNVFPAGAETTDVILDRFPQVADPVFSFLEHFTASSLYQVDEHLLAKVGAISEFGLKGVDVWVTLFNRSKGFNKFLINLGLLFHFGKIFGRAFDESNRVCFLCGDVNLLICSFRLAEQDIGLDVRVEEYRLLHNIAALLPQVQNVVLLQIFVVDQHLSIIDVVETKQNID